MSQAVAGTGVGASGKPRSERPFWREALAPYAKPNIGRSVLDITTSVVPYLALSYLMYLTLSVSYLLVLFGFGPIWAMIVARRFVPRGVRPRIRRSIIATNVALTVIVGGLCWVIGWQAFLLVQLPTAWLAGSAGVFLFFVQHQFEDAYWENTGTWSYAEAALRGSSYLKLPKVLQYFTGNIGLHHVHHLSVRIPNYNLQRAH